MTWRKSRPLEPGRYKIRRVVASCDCGGCLREDAGEVDIFPDGDGRLWAAPRQGRKHARLLKELGGEYEWSEA